MIFSFLFVPSGTYLNILRKNNFSISFHILFLISWTVIIDVITITNVLTIFLYCEP